MSGFCRLVALTALVGLPDLAAGQAALSERAQTERATRVTERVPSRSTTLPASSAPVIQTASLAAGWIEGSVTDERSRPVAGAAVWITGFAAVRAA